MDERQKVCFHCIILATVYTVLPIYNSVIVINSVERRSYLIFIYL